MLVAAVLALLSIIIYPASILSTAIIALITLRKGWYEGSLIIGSASIVTGILGYFLIKNYTLAIGYALVLFIPVWLIAIVLREGKKLSFAFEIAIFISTLGILALYLFNSDPQAMWKSYLTTIMQPILSNSEAPIDDIKMSISFLSKYMSGFMAAGMISGLFAGLLLGRWWQSVLFNPGGFRAEFLQLKTSPILGISSILLLVAALLSHGKISEMSWNIVIVFFVFYSFTGVSVLHTVFSTMQQKKIILSVFYIISFLVPHLLFIVASIGLADTWVDFRSKIKK